MQWHWANLEYCVSTDLDNLSLLHWDQVTILTLHRERHLCRVNAHIYSHANSFEQNARDRLLFSHIP